MNPYLSFSLAMCAVVAISLFFTGYLAVHFNRRAKTDLGVALTPIAEVIGGEVDLELAAADGRYGGHIAQGRVSNATDGPGRVFLTSIVDGAGGEPWTYTVSQPKDQEKPKESRWEGDQLPDDLRAAVASELDALLTQPGWARLSYDPASGFVRLTRPMTTRRDIPGAPAFTNWLDLLVRVAEINRRWQQSS